jgi:hypothetical protein
MQQTVSRHLYLSWRNGGVADCEESTPLQSLSPLPKMLALQSIRSNAAMPAICRSQKEMGDQEYSKLGQAAADEAVSEDHSR